MSDKTEITLTDQNDWGDILAIIEKARENAFRAVNRELINMYWEIGHYVSERAAHNGWGKSTVKDFADFVQSQYIGISGFSASNILANETILRNTYSSSEKLAPLVRELSWTHNLMIMTADTPEKREFYVTLTIKNRYSKRELKRQMESMLYERTMLSEVTNKLFIEKSPGLSVLRDSYVLEFLDIPEKHQETDLRRAIVLTMKDFILEFGKDFSFVGAEYRVQVGNTDFFIDLLFYHRSLSCLVAIELKTKKFEPGHLGQLEFYLEALDRDVRKPHENPSVGLILCAEKDNTVVEYALSRSMSPALIADYKLHLPDKALLENKLRELTELAEKNTDENNGGNNE